MAIQDYRPKTVAPGPTNYGQARAVDTSGLKQLGAGLADVGEVLTRASHTRQVNAARLALTEGLGSLNAELREDTDFETMTDRYGERLDGLKESVLAGLRAPGLKADMEVEFSRARVAAEANVGRRRFELEGQRARADLLAMARSTANAIPVAGSPEEAANLYSQAVTAADEAVAAGYMTAEQAEHWRQRLDGNVSSGMFLRDMNEDPARALEILESDNNAYGFDAIDREQAIAQATRAISQGENARLSKLKTKSDAAIDAMLKGRPVEGLGELMAEAEGTEYDERLRAAAEASQQLGGFYAASPQERKDAIAARKAAGVNVELGGFDNEFLNAMERMDEQATKDAREDPIEYAKRTGHRGYAPIDLGDPESITARIATAVAVAQEQGVPPKLFSKTEAADIGKQIEEGTADDQLALAVAITSGFPARQAAVAFTELGAEDPLFAHAGRMVLETGDAKAAAAVLRGRKAIEAGEEARAPSEEARAVVMDELAGALNGAPPGARESVIKAADAYYAAMAPGRIGADDFRDAQELYREAIQRVLGGRDVDGRARGGVQEVNGIPTLLPVGVAGEDIERAVARGIDKTIWAQAAPTGSVPTAGGKVDLPRRPVFRAVGGGLHMVGTRSGRGGVEWYRDDAAGAGYLLVDLSKLITADSRGGFVPKQKGPEGAR